ncbi:hypothetical protein AB0I28_12305 [Phytomonospora sp. NPDC050363]|uniref:hypothetical protein n=1 Tax=Phytomonospora sp. NPDC050363 TaxID=3155642 RepID=UPI0033F643BA
MDDARTEAVMQIYDEVFEEFTRDVITEVIKRRRERTAIPDAEYWTTNRDLDPKDWPW